SRFGRLTARIGVNLRIDHENIDILPGCDYMVETSETDIVSPTVAADNPLRLLGQVILHGEDFTAGVAAARFEHRHEAVAHLPVARRAVARLYPFAHSMFQLFRAAGAVLHGIPHLLFDAVA